MRLVRGVSSFSLFFLMYVYVFVFVFRKKGLSQVVIDVNDHIFSINQPLNWQAKLPIGFAVMVVT